MKTFTEFLKSDEGEECADPEFVARLARSGIEPESLHQLVNFARQRWPDSYHKDYRKNAANAPNGREVMARVWSKFLHWKEGL
ncbi:hypothetical protein ACVIWV_007103 [Bradyrhizobium diazoefficiens]